MTPQFTPVTFVHDNGDNVILPGRSGTPKGESGHGQFVRNDAAFGSGSYRVYFSDGTFETISGPGSVGNSQLSVEVTYNPETQTLTATPSGGTAATYQWFIKSSTTAAGESDSTFAGPTNTNTAVISPAGADISVGNAAVKVTDTLGRITWGFYAVRIAPTI